jgi:hypothetical protein
MADWKGDRTELYSAVQTERCSVGRTAQQTVDGMVCPWALTKVILSVERMEKQKAGSWGAR